MRAPVRVWDLPTRLFHWALAGLVAFSVVTVKLGGFWMDWHMRSGYAILALVLFRVMWGFAGSRYALFASFVRQPAEIIGYLRGRVEHGAGHSPLAAVSVLALLGLLLVQAGTGLFSNDGNFTEGPLARLVSGAAGERLSTVHRFGEWAIYALVGLHVAAIAYYTTFRNVALVRPMITGDRFDVEAPPADDGLAMRLRALALAGAAAAVVAFIVSR
ncbi:MAG: cytochrome b/b6 domain-containing protein [Betaproteobacteria bacterium]